MERETVEAYGLATIGVCKGIYEVFIKDIEPRHKAWVALAGSVICYDLLAKDGQTLSEGVDHYLEKHPVMTLGAIAITAGHLANIIPESIDPIHQLHRLVR